MKKSFFKQSIVIMMFVLPGLFSSGSLFAQGDTKGLKIGVYDSRVIVIAYSRSKAFQDHLTKLKQQSDSAKEQKDSVRYKDLSIRMMSYQHLLHQMAFGTGSVAEIMKFIQDKLPELANQNGVALIVSKFEIPYKGSSLEMIDLTLPIAKLFNPAEDISKMAEDIKKANPVAMEDLAIEPEMLDYYVQLFGKK